MKRIEPPTDKITLAKKLRDLADQVEMGNLDAIKRAQYILSRPKKPRKKYVSPIDAFKIIRDEGENGLRNALELLNIDKLRDVLLAYGLDRQQLARKWTKEERLRKYILERLLIHYKSGDVFTQS